MHGSSAAVAGEFAIVPPFLGSSQRLLNRDHYSVYYKVRTACASSARTEAAYCMVNVKHTQCDFDFPIVHVVLMCQHSLRLQRKTANPECLS